jgi:hypothetical protein
VPASTSTATSMECLAVDQVVIERVTN